jgi:glycosyltransferase involved in cell wall biosynthesis
VHIETLRGLPVNLPHGLERAGVGTIVSLDDFSLLCRRPHLIDTITGRFCNYCQDMERCDACLRDMDPERRYPQKDYRKISAATIHAATALVFPSPFLQRQHQRLFPSRGPGQREFVLPPATRRPEDLADRTVREPNFGFIGGVLPHKGARLIPPVMDRIRSRRSKARGFVYGAGDLELVAQIKRSDGIKVRGFYRRGTLGELLIQDEISVAVLPSIWPEAYAVVVDECLAAGIPVVAFEHGAVGDRLEFWSTGALVPKEGGADGLAEAALGELAGHAVKRDVIKILPNLERLVQKYLDMYTSIRRRHRKTQA